MCLHSWFPQACRREACRRVSFQPGFLQFPWNRWLSEKCWHWELHGSFLGDIKNLEQFWSWNWTPENLLGLKVLGLVRVWEGERANWPVRLPWAWMAALCVLIRRQVCWPGSRRSWIPQWKRGEAGRGAVSRNSLREKGLGFRGAWGTGWGTGSSAVYFIKPLANDHFCPWHSQGNPPYRLCLFGLFAGRL